MENKYIIGDVVQIVEYGHLFFAHKTQEISERWKVIKTTTNYIVVDLRPELVGKFAVVREVTKTQARWKYSLMFDDGHRRAWFDENQLEFVKNAEPVDRYKSIKGENHYAAKLTRKDVEEIRASEETCMKLGERYGVHYSHISRIKNNQKWKT